LAVCYPMAYFRMETIHTGNSLIARTAAISPNATAMSKKTVLRLWINWRGLSWLRSMYRARFSSGVTSETGCGVAEELRFFVMWSPVDAMALFGRILRALQDDHCHRGL